MLTVWESGAGEIVAVASGAVLEPQHLDDLTTQTLRDLLLDLAPGIGPSGHVP